MIITESEWNRAAGIEEVDAPVSPPSYDDTLGISIAGPSGLSPRSREASSSASRSREAQARSSPQSPPALPPRGEEGGSRRYEERVSQEPIVYTFVQQSPNSMLLIYQPAMLPLYRISIHVNCFIPTSHVTIIRRGDSEDGNYVGQFEMGISVKKSTIIIDGKEKLTDAVLIKSKDKSNRTLLWKWSNDESKHLSWSYEGPVKYCYLRVTGNAQPPMIATYTPPPLTPRADGRSAPPTILKIFPAGQEFFDHILVSALVIERKRLTPISANPLMSWS